MRKLMWFTLGFLCACLAAVYFAPASALLWASLAAAALLAAHWRVLRRLRPVRAVLLGLAAGLLWCGLYGLLVIGPAHDSAAGQSAVRAAVCSYSVKKDNSSSVDVYAETRAGAVKTTLYLYGLEEELRPGDVITGTFKLRPSDRRTDGSRYYDAQARGVLLIGSGAVSGVERPERVPLRYLPLTAARELRELLAETVPQDAAGFLEAIVTGERGDLSDADRDRLSASGLSHVIAVSGMHVGLLLTLTVLLIGRGGWLRTSVQAAVLVVFALVTGSSPSVLRACVMLLLLLYAPCFRRAYDPPTALSAAALLILLPNPWACANVSFQLSFSAVAGLLLIGAPLRNRMLAMPKIKKLRRWAGPAALPDLLRKPLSFAVRKTASFAVSCTSATVGVLILTTPIAALVFGSFPTWALLSNLLALPLLLPCFAGGLLCLALGAIRLPLGCFAGSLVAWPVRWILLVCRTVSALPLARLPADTVYGAGFLVAVYVLLVLFWVLKEQRLRRLVLQVGLCLLIACGFTLLSRKNASFTAAALNVGQGQCIVLRSEDFCAVVDCGGSVRQGSGAYAAEFLTENGVDTINVLVLTHYDSDHINGFSALLDRVGAEAVFLPDVAFDPERRAWAEEAAEAHGIPIYYVEHDLKIAFSGGTMDLFAPVSLYDDNAASLSVLFSAGEYDMLITGDMDIWAEYDLLLTHALPKVEAYVAGHHGSKHSSSEELLAAIEPDTVLISVGGDNRYGHPDPETLERFAQIGAEVLRTDQQGDLIIGR